MFTCCTAPTTRWRLWLVSSLRIEREFGAAARPAHPTAHGAVAHRARSTCRTAHKSGHTTGSVAILDENLPAFRPPPSQ